MLGEKKIRKNLVSNPWICYDMIKKILKFLKHFFHKKIVE